eukprot:TRINITY_DN12888_c0_g1_i1.p1 TRINITY_DN12888_c0_g1~~TRINITY_DN12888_c0_g1_i1.p1  ORF type:complete len:316 (-),score=83.37 TRINITY_DN12888_c0_g1_i1:660-1568(-)
MQAWGSVDSPSNPAERESPTNVTVEIPKQEPVEEDFPHNDSMCSDEDSDEFDPKETASWSVVDFDCFKRVSPLNHLCRIERNRKGIKNRRAPEYFMYIDGTTDPVLGCKRQVMNRHPNYHFFDLTKSHRGAILEKGCAQYVGKLRSFKSCTESILYDAGEKERRREHLAVVYEKPSAMSVLKKGSRPRRVKVLIPKSGEPIDPVSDDDTILGRYRGERIGAKDALLMTQSKEPSLVDGVYRLNFGGRVSKPSIKNFQLASPDDSDTVLLQFGKIGDDLFTLDFRAPFSPIQAFAMAVCQFQL